VALVSLAAMLSACATAAPARGLALEGFGTSTPGGAGYVVVRVTTLDDDGPGSLREALRGGGYRTIVFDVAGDIVLGDHLYVGGPFVTIDGFTAPPPGITLRNRGLIVRGRRGAHDVIVRGLRVRDSTIDGIQVAYGAYNVVIDHVSVDGSDDGNIDITESRDVTVSWSILSGNNKSMLVKYGPARVTLHHNLYVDAATRNPQIRMDDLGTPATEITADLRNNVVAHWTGYGTLAWGGAWVNVVNNYFTSGDDALVVSAARAYTAGNLSADGKDLNHAGTETDPFVAAPVHTADACTAAAHVLLTAGVRPLDERDTAHLTGVTLAACP
jgi:pectate lyase